MELEYDFGDRNKNAFEEDGVVFIPDENGDFFVYLVERPGITSEIKKGERSQAREHLECICDAIEGWDD
jgi:hypothetical protein